MRNRLVASLVLLFALIILHGPAGAQVPIDFFARYNPSTEDDLGNAGLVQRTFTGQINADALRAFGEIENGREPSSVAVEMRLFSEWPITIVFKRSERISATGLALIGYVQGVDGSEVVLIVNGPRVTGDINLPGQLFHIRPAGDDSVHQVQDIDISRFPDELEPLIPDTEILPAPAASLQGDDGTQIDLLVVYTEEARNAVGGKSAMESKIDLAVAETNQGYANSGITQRIRLVHREEITYNESGFDWYDALDRLVGTADGYMDTVHALRNTYQADVVVLIVNNGTYCGISYLMRTVSPSFADHAFSIVSQYCATGYYSFAHEMGHVMGAHHDRANAGGTTGAYSYAYGYQEPAGDFRTVMAYANGCLSSCPRINYWSNPDIKYSGKPTGIIYTDPQAADNRKTLNSTVSTVANFRAAAVTLPIISGIILSNGSPLQGVVLSGLPGTPVTNVSGYYSTTVPANWSGTVTPVLAGHTFAPSCRTYTDVKTDQESQNYTGTPATYTLVVEKSGTGTGTVTSAPSGITCGATCSVGYTQGTTVTLTATAGPSALFGGWTGAGCSGTGTCTVTMNGNTTIEASFSPLTYTVTPQAGPNGTITPATPQMVNHGATTTFTVTPNAGYSASVTGCGGILAGNTYTTGPITGTCTVNATFTLQPPDQRTLTVSRSGNGSGTITSSPGGISCGSTCSASYTSGTLVTLTASPQTGSIFTGWSGGGCSGTGTCTVTMTATTSVDGSFTAHTYVVTPQAGLHGTMTPNIPIQVAHGSTTSFTLTPDTGYRIDTVSGCNGTLTGTLYTTGPITQACTVTASFIPACTYTLSPSSKTFPAKGFGLSTNVTVTGSGMTVCPAPSVRSEVPWITATMGLWSKNKATVKVTVTPSTQSSVRTGTVTIGDTVFTATQAGAPCSVTALSPTTTTFPKTGGDQTFTVTTSTTDCSWSASTTQSSWIHITSGSGTGNGSVTFFVDPFAGTMTRSGSIVVQPTSGGTFSSKKTFTVKQTK